MKRFKIIGLCLVAVFALTAVMASVAQAGQFGFCVKAEKHSVEYELNGKKKTKSVYKGKFSDKGCSTPAPEPGTYGPEPEGKYEWAPNTKVVPFTSEGGAASLKGGPGELTSPRNVDTGKILNATENEDQVTFYEVKLNGALPCYNAEEEVTVGKGKTEKKEKIKVLKTNKLKSKLIDHGEKGPSGEEPKPGEVWMELEAAEETIGSFGEKGFYQASFACYLGETAIPFDVTGTLSGVIPAEFVEAKLKAGKPAKAGKPLTSKATFNIDFGAGKGEQDLKTKLFNPESMMIETVASTQTATDGIIIEKANLEKGFSISDLGL